MSGAMPKVAGAAQSAFAKVDASATKAKKSIDNVSAKPVQVKADTRQVDDAISKVNKLGDTIERTNRRAKASAPLRGGMGSFGMGGLLGGIGVSAGIGYALNAGLDAEANKVAFQTMAGNAPGNKLYGDLTKYAQNTIYGNEVYKEAKTMLAFGVATDKIMPSLKMLGDIAMGDKQRMESLALVFGQTRSAGKLMGQDLLQYINAGFNPLKELSEMTKKPYDQLKKLSEQGKISADMVEAAFVHATSAGGRFYDMTNRIANTDYGKLQNLKGQLDGIALKLGGVLAPKLGAFIDQYGDKFINTLSRGVDWLTKNWDTIVKFAGGIIAAKVAVSTYTTAQWAMNAAMSANPALLLAGAVGFLSYKLLTASSDVDNLYYKLNTTINNPQLATMYSDAGTKYGTLYAQSFSNAAKQISLSDEYSQKYSWLGNLGIYPFWGELFDKGYITQTRHNSEDDRWKNKVVDTKKLPGAKMFGGLTNSLYSGSSKSKGTVADYMSGGSLSGLGSSAGGGTDVITGGGKRQVIINFNKEVVASGAITQHINNGGVQMSAFEIRRIVTQHLDQIADSVGGIDNN